MREFRLWTLTVPFFVIKYIFYIRLLISVIMSSLAFDSVNGFSAFNTRMLMVFISSGILEQILVGLLVDEVSFYWIDSEMTALKLLFEIVAFLNNKDTQLLVICEQNISIWFVCKEIDVLILIMKLLIFSSGFLSHPMISSISFTFLLNLACWESSAIISKILLINCDLSLSSPSPSSFGVSFFSARVSSSWAD